MLAMGMSGNWLARLTAWRRRPSSRGTGILAGLVARYFSTPRPFQNALRSCQITTRSPLLECRVRLRALARRPRDRVVLAAVTRPRIEGVDHVLELGRQLGNRPHQHAL